MQAALQGVLDAVLCARRGSWLHPESSPAWKQTLSVLGPPGVRSAQPAGQMAQTMALPAQGCQPCYCLGAVGTASGGSAASRAGMAPGVGEHCSEWQEGV